MMNHTMRTVVIAILAALAAGPAAAAAMDPPVWLDMETCGGPADWDAPQGQLTVSAGHDSVGSADVPLGLVLHLAGQPGGLVQTRKGLLTNGLADASSVTLWLRAGASSKTSNPWEIEIQFVEAGGGPRFWRMVQVHTSAWTRVELPLRFFQPTGVRRPQWSKVRHLAIRFPTAGHLWLDHVGFVREPGRDTELGLDELREIAFPDAPESAVRTIRTSEYAVMTDSPAVDLKILEASLARVAAELRGLCPSLPPPHRPAVLLVFSTDAARQVYLDRMADQTGAPPARSNRAGIVPFTWNTPKPLPASIPFHAFVQAWLSQAGGLAGEDGWLNRAIAKHFLCAEADQRALAIRTLRSIDWDRYTAFKDLCVDQPPEAEADWQLASLFGMLRSREPYASRLPDFLRAVREENSLDLHWHLGPVFGVDFPRLTGDWEAYCSKAYAPPGPSPLDDSELRQAALRFSLTPTNDPAYNEALAAYCRLIRKQIEGLQKSGFVKAVSRDSFGPKDFASWVTIALVGRGWWRDCESDETHLLDDGPLWFVMRGEAELICGRGISLYQDLGIHKKLVTMAGLTLEELDAAAAGRGLPARRQDEPDFPPTHGKLRESNLPFQYDIWLPRETYRQGELIVAYCMVRNRTDATRRIDWWRTIYQAEGEWPIEGEGPDGKTAMDFALYKVENNKERRRIPADPRLESCIEWATLPRPAIPPHGALIYVMQLNRAYDVSNPGEYEIWATYRSESAKPRSLRDVFHGLLPAPPVRFRVVPPWHVTWGRRALIALPVVVLLAAGGVLVRRRSIRARPSPAAPPPHS